MASGRSYLALLCVCSVLLVLVAADVTVAGDGQQHQPATGVTGTTEKFYLRGNPAGASADEAAAEEVFDSFARRELNDYGRNPAGSNCKVNCKR